MIFKKDSVIEELEHRLKSIVEVYKKRGMSTQQIRMHLLIPKNFDKIIHLMGDLHSVYDEQKYVIRFETMVYDLLFFGIALMERIYPCEKCDDENQKCDCEEEL